MERESELARQSIDLAVQAVGFYKWLVDEKKEFVMSRQLLRSATSTGANIHEAYYAVSRPDFISKMQIALKEAAETDYWLIVMERTGYFDKRFEPIKSLNTGLIKMLTSTLNTAKKQNAEIQNL